MGTILTEKLDLRKGYLEIFSVKLIINLLKYNNLQHGGRITLLIQNNSFLAIEEELLYYSRMPFFFTIEEKLIPAFERG